MTMRPPANDEEQVTFNDGVLHFRMGTAWMNATGFAVYLSDSRIRASGLAGLVTTCVDWVGHVVVK